jgi:hypothetical protein
VAVDIKDAAAFTSNTRILNARKYNFKVCLPPIATGTT